MSKYSKAHKVESLPVIKELTRNISKKSYVLDVGCSSGYLGRYLTEEKECVVDGVELDTHDAEVAKNFLNNVYVFDLDQNWPKSIYRNKYNFVIFADVLEHLKDPGRVLRETKKILAPNAKIIISIPNIAHISTRLELMRGGFEYESLGILDETHTKYFTFASATNLLRNNGYEVLDVDYTLNDFPKEVISKLLKEIDLNPGKDFWREVKTPQARAYQLRFLATPSKNGKAKHSSQGSKKGSKMKQKPLQFRDDYIADLVKQIENQREAYDILKKEFGVKMYLSLKKGVNLAKKASRPKSYINLIKRLKK